MATTLTLTPLPGGGLEVTNDTGRVILTAEQSDHLLAFQLARLGLLVEPPRCTECGAELTASDVVLEQRACGECAGL